MPGTVVIWFSVTLLRVHSDLFIDLLDGHKGKGFLFVLFSHSGITNRFKIGSRSKAAEKTRPQHRLVRSREKDPPETNRGRQPELHRKHSSTSLRRLAPDFTDLGCMQEEFKPVCLVH